MEEPGAGEVQGRCWAGNVRHVQVDVTGGGSLSPGHAQPSQARGQCDDPGGSLIWAGFACGCGLRDDAKPFSVIWDADRQRCDEHAALTAASASSNRNRGAQRQSLLAFAAFAE